MRWDFVVEHWAARLLADEPLRSVMGADSGWVYPAQSAKAVKVPSIEYTLIYEAESELWNRFGLQVDLFVRGVKKAAQVERRVRLLTHGDVGQVLGGERLWMQFRDARNVEYPAAALVTHRILDFECEAGREKYITA